MQVILAQARQLAKQQATASRHSTVAAVVAALVVKYRSLSADVDAEE
jgi:hypothetical protein